MGAAQPCKFSIKTNSSTSITWATIRRSDDDNDRNSFVYNSIGFGISSIKRLSVFARMYNGCNNDVEKI